VARVVLVVVVLVGGLAGAVRRTPADGACGVVPQLVPPMASRVNSTSPPPYHASLLAT